MKEYFEKSLNDIKDNKKFENLKTIQEFYQTLYSGRFTPDAQTNEELEKNEIDKMLKILNQAFSKESDIKEKS